MGLSADYPNVPDWVSKPEGYQAGSVVKYQGNIFRSVYWASEPGVGDPATNGWRLFDELYDRTPATPTAEAKVIGYCPSWRKRDGFDFSDDEVYRSLTHALIAFLMFSETSPGTFDAASVADVMAILPAVVDGAHRNGARALVSIGGGTDFGFLNLMTAIGNNPTHPLLDETVKNIANFVSANALDGVDLDLECWWGRPGEPDQGGRLKADGAHPAGYALTLLAQRLKAAMPGKLVSAAVFGTSYYGNNFDPRLADHVDWLGVMTYDFTGSWNTSAVGPHSALYKIREQSSSVVRAADVYQETYAAEQQGAWPSGGPENNPILSVEDALWFWTNPFFTNWQGAGHAVPRSKIVGGVPLYGYDFALGKGAPDPVTGEVPNGYRTITYRDILAAFPGAETAPGAHLAIPGSTPRPPFVSPPQPGDYPYAHNIYFETPATAVAKLDFLKGVGAQGVIIWDVTTDARGDGRSVVGALYAASGNPARRDPLGRIVVTGAGARFGGQTASGQWNDAYQTCLPLALDGTRYVFAHKTSQVAGGGTGAPGLWAIHPLLPGGTLGPPSDGGQWESDYPTCFSYTVDGWTYLFGHRSERGTGQGSWFIRTLLPGGKLSVQTDAGQWANGYQTCFPFRVGDRTYMFGHKTGDAGGGTVSAGYWFIQELLERGKMGAETDTGQWPDAFATCFPFTIGGRTHLLAHKTGLGSGRARWFVRELLPGGKMGAETDAGQWPDAYGRCSPFALDGRAYVLAHRTAQPAPGQVSPGHRFTQELLPGGKLGAVTDSGEWPDAYGTCFPTRIGGQTLVFGQRSDARAGSAGPGYWFLQELVGDRAPYPESDWEQVRAANTYSTCTLTGTLDMQQDDYTSSCTLRVEPGAPFLYAAVTAGEDTTAFPTGVLVSVRDSNGQAFDRDLVTDAQHVVASGASLRSLIVKDPAPGDWTITVTAPAGTSFRVHCDVAPSRDPYVTVMSAPRGAAHGLQPRSPAMAWLDVAVVSGILVVVSPELVGAALLVGLLVVLFEQPENRVRDDRALWDNAAKKTPKENCTYINDIAAEFARNPIQAYPVRLATWNVYHGDRAARDPNGQPNLSRLADRLNELTNFGVANGIDLLAFQEVPQTLLNDPTFIASVPPSYAAVPIPQEYPTRRTINDPPASSATSDGYLVLYRRAALALVPVNGQSWEFLRPDMFVRGVSQNRPPARLTLRTTAVPARTFDFFTWHTEPQSAIAADDVSTFFALMSLPRTTDWIIAGDLNVTDARIPAGYVRGRHHLTHTPGSLDHIVTNRDVEDPTTPVVQQLRLGNGQTINGIVVDAAQWGRFYSDVHWALFGIWY